MAWFEIHIHQTVDTNEVEKKLNRIIKQNNDTMASIAQLTQKVDALQAALDAEQQEIQDAIAALNTTLQELRDQIANNEGGTVEERQALADKLDAIKTDLEGTVNNAPTEPEPNPNPEA